jgi:hypothetical protein
VFIDPQMETMFSSWIRIRSHFLLDFASCIPLVGDVGFSSVMFEDWVFWICLVSLILMAGRQLKRDVLAICDWIVVAKVVTKTDADDVPEGDEVHEGHAGDEGHEGDYEGQEVPVTVGLLTMASSSSAGPSTGLMSHPTVPIYVSRHGERYHYNLQCRGLRSAIPLGVELKTLCKLCDLQRRR